MGGLWLWEEYARGWEEYVFEGGRSLKVGGLCCGRALRVGGVRVWQESDNPNVDISVACR